MACPFFHATERLNERQETRPMPLGDLYAGECHAQADGYRPNEAQLRSFCNLGYARGACPRFPKDAAFDAVRFSISRDEELSFTISYVEERDHRPGEHGGLQYQVAGQRFVKPHANQIVNRLAEAYAEAYLRRRAQAVRPAQRAAP